MLPASFDKSMAVSSFKFFAVVRISIVDLVRTLGNSSDEKASGAVLSFIGEDIGIQFPRNSYRLMMTHRILAEVSASISELKTNPMKVVASGNGMPIAVLNRNEPAFYCVPAAAYEAMMELLDDAELLKIVKERMDEPAVSVLLDDL